MSRYYIASVSCGRSREETKSAREILTGQRGNIQSIEESRADRLCLTFSILERKTGDKRAGALSYALPHLVFVDFHRDGTAAPRQHLHNLRVCERSS